MPIDFNKKHEPKPPARDHPTLEHGYTRVKVLEIKAETDRARLCKLEDGAIWIPRSVSTFRNGNKNHQLQPAGTLDDAIDIINWWYDKNIATWD